MKFCVVGCSRVFFVVIIVVIVVVIIVIVVVHVVAFGGFCDFVVVVNFGPVVVCRVDGIVVVGIECLSFHLHFHRSIRSSQC